MGQKNKGEPGRLALAVLAPAQLHLEARGRVEVLVLGVEHRADPKPMAPDGRDGYVSEAAVISAAEAAGFRLAARSEINANPKDTKDHPFGVWTLPPSRNTAPNGQPADPKFDRTKYDAIGESDRMTLRFVKPG